MDLFVPQSPDPFLKKDSDMSLAKFGHINAIVDELNVLNNALYQMRNNIYANNNAALNGGLVPGDFYRTSLTGVVHVVHL
jgi:hypothetical protein